MLGGGALVNRCRFCIVRATSKELEQELTESLRGGALGFAFMCVYFSISFLIILRSWLETRGRPWSPLEALGIPGSNRNP